MPDQVPASAARDLVATSVPGRGAADATSCDDDGSIERYAWPSANRFRQRARDQLDPVGARSKRSSRGRDPHARTQVGGTRSLPCSQSCSQSRMHMLALSRPASCSPSIRSSFAKIASTKPALSLNGEHTSRASSSALMPPPSLVKATSMIRGLVMRRRDEPFSLQLSTLSVDSATGPTASPKATSHPAPTWRSRWGRAISCDVGSTRGALFAHSHAHLVRWLDHPIES